jgi:hypothetical protein
MSRLLIKLIGVFLLLFGVYYLGQDIIFTTRYYPYFWRSMPAAGSVLAITGGVIALVFFRREAGNLGWFLLALGIVLVFLSGGVLLQATTLWKLFIGLVALAVGYKLLSEGRIRF